MKDRLLQNRFSSANDLIWSFITLGCFYKLVYLVKLEWSMWKRADHIQNLVLDSLQHWDYKGDNRPPPPSLIPAKYTHMHTQTEEHGTKMQFPCKFLAYLQKDFHIQRDSDSNPLFSLLNLLIYLYIYTYFISPSLRLPVSFSCVGLMQVLCNDQNIRARGRFTLLFLSLYLFMWHLVLLPHPAQCFAGIQML